MFYNATKEKYYGDTELTCTVCGKNDIRISRTSYDDKSGALGWEKWAKENVTLCSTCYRRLQTRKRREEELVDEFDEIAKNEFSDRIVLHVIVMPDVDKLSGETLARCYFTGAVMKNRESIQSIGYEWLNAEELYTGKTIKYISMKNNQWTKIITESEYHEEIRKAEDIGAEITDADLTNLWYAKKRYIAWEKELKESAEENLVEPEEPEIIAGKRWNGKFYGHNLIYVDDEKIRLSEEIVDQLHDYNDAKEIYSDRETLDDEYREKIYKERIDKFFDEQEKAVSLIEEPGLPDILNDTWDGIIHGKIGHRKVTLDGESIEITEKDVDEIKKYRAQKQKYENEVDKQRRVRIYCIHSCGPEKRIKEVHRISWDRAHYVWKWANVTISEGEDLLSIDISTEEDGKKEIRHIDINDLANIYEYADLSKREKLEIRKKIYETVCYGLDNGVLAIPCETYNEHHIDKILSEVEKTKPRLADENLTESKSLDESVTHIKVGNMSFSLEEIKESLERVDYTIVSKAELTEISKDKWLT